MIKQFIIQFDTQITTLIQQWPEWLRGPMLAITTIGHPVSLLLISLAVSGLVWRMQPRIAISLAWATVAMIGSGILKHFIHRTRPDTLYVSNMWFATSSFPSGHSFGSMVVLGLLAYLSAVYLPAPWQYIAPLVLGLCIVAVGISRVYLGAHFPTDVLAGWGLGALALLLIILVIKP